jgi:hypothetical protein
LNNTTGPGNTATGAFALYGNITGNGNTASGFDALYGNVDGNANTAFGIGALSNNIHGDANTAVGASALSSSTGNYNTAIGWAALEDNTADGNTATGYQALRNNTTGSFNTATGHHALGSNTVGITNTAVGNGALQMNQTGSSNTAVGNGALSVGAGDNNIALGAGAGGGLLTGSSNIFIGNFGGDGSHSILIGNPQEHFQTFIAGIYGNTAIAGLPVYISPAHKLGTTTSSKRFKENIQPMAKASEAVLALKPVSFRYKKEIDPEGRSQFGLVAEDVEKVNPDLVVRDKDGKPYTVRYDQVNAMLLNEFLKEHKKVEDQRRKIQEQENTITELKKEMETVIACLRQHDSKIQSVSHQIELNKIALQMTANQQN